MLDDTLFRTLVARAIKAPSSHNTQPWIFRRSGDAVQLLADRTRALPVNDPEDRELTISCGAALMGLRVAAAGDGVGTSVVVLPDRDDPDLLAEVRIGGSADPALSALAAAIDLRRTYRKRFAEAPVPEAALADLVAAAAAEAARLDPLGSEDTRQGVAALVAKGDAEQWHDMRWRRELAAWMHPRRSGDGLTLPWLARPVAQLVVRSFDLGGGVAAKDAELAEHSPVLALLGTGTDDATAWLAAGQALQRVLLVAAAAGLQASYLNQPIQVAHLRPLVAEVAQGAPHPQVLLRIGVPEEALEAAPRRPLDAVIEG